MRLLGYCWIFVCLFAASIVAHAQPGRNLSTGQRVLTGTDWRLVSLGPAGAEVNVVPGTTVTLKFGDDGRASGSTGCNSYSGTYEVRGDNLSFGRLISTRRACLDQNANEQEQRFLSFLEMASRFRLNSDRLTIFSDRGRNVLNFTSNTPTDPDNGPPRDDSSDPVAALLAYYRAINAKDYRRAFRFWETPPSPFEQFVRGFEDTQSARILIEPPVRLEGAAGSTYSEIPTMIVTITRRGTERVFVGCYVIRRSNVRDVGWQIYRADIAAMPSGARVSRLLTRSCRFSQ